MAVIISSYTRLIPFVSPYVGNSIVQLCVVSKWLLYNCSSKGTSLLITWLHHGQTCLSVYNGVLHKVNNTSTCLIYISCDLVCY